MGSLASDVDYSGIPCNCGCNRDSRSGYRNVIRVRTMNQPDRRTFIGSGSIEVDRSLNYLIITLPIKHLSEADAKLLHGRHAKVQVEV